MLDKKVIPIDEHGCYFLTLETVDMVDVFTKPVYKQIVVHTLNHFVDNKGLVVYGWCLMTNRLYLIAQAQRHVLLGDIRKGFKQFTSEKIIEAIHSEPMEKQSWMLQRFEKPAGLFSGHKKPGCWKKVKDPILIDCSNPDSMAEHLEFIHNAPVKERVVQYPADYYYSSARDYVDGISGLVKITKPSGVEQALEAMENRKSSFKVKYNR
ncbi:MAG: hypothetical protein BGN92_10570 [Sphingobacteriales bacterium 41-5]|nr:MAG: hypothetical protein ABS67_03125 [Niabella sp. SCN 42-15]OJU26056.1 MAG: hypothetical protein BGN92_10570 [Sphingobacteriales bacterium 41-5]